MSVVRRLVVGLLLLVAMLVAVAFFLPREISIARSITINAPETDIFPHLNSPKKFNVWSPWAARDPKTRYTFSGPTEGKGAKMAWQSDHPEVGSGSQQIVESESMKRVKVLLDFGDMGAATADYVLEPSGAGTKITWGFGTDVGNNPLKRWMGLMFGRWIGQDYETGLKRLKSLVESGSATAGTKAAGS